MKKILSEEKIAGILFMVVMIVFSFAHEDSKKRNSHYSTSFPEISISRPASVQMVENSSQKMAVSATIPAIK
jgi:hypothetical protein